jgi:hypothetical protein
MDDGDVSDAPSGDDEVDEMRRVTEISNVWSACLRSSWNGDEERPELKVRHVQDGYNDERWFWVMIVLPEDAED